MIITNDIKETAVENAVSYVNHPSHYNVGQFEVIDVIEDWNLNFNLGNAIKYIGRAGHKDPTRTIEDLEKAAWYVQREIQRLKKEGNKP